MNEIKKQLRQYYNDNVDERDKSQKQSWKIDLRNKFLLSMKGNSCVSLLEIGAGTGQDSMFFAENSMDVTTVDLSDKHIEKCKEKGLRAEVMDFSALSFADNSFDCIYAMNCLLHFYFYHNW